MASDEKCLYSYHGADTELKLIEIENGCYSLREFTPEGICVFDIEMSGLEGKRLARWLNKIGSQS